MYPVVFVAHMNICMFAAMAASHASHTPLRNAQRIQPAALRSDHTYAYIHPIFQKNQNAHGSQVFYGAETSKKTCTRMHLHRVYGTLATPSVL
jgi:hypothetical protein